MEIKIKKSPHDIDKNFYPYSKIKINPGFTALVGCNGCGKSTLLGEIKNFAKQNNIEIAEYDGLTDGKQANIEKALLKSNFGLISNLTMASEGEGIKIAFGEFVRTLRAFCESVRDKPAFIILDAIDSGLSIDNVCDLKEFFNFLCKTNPKKEIYIIAAVNNYELAENAQCINVRTGKPISFKSYTKYKNYIMRSRKKRDDMDY